jgi:signal-transduction protein with cAMP-binding, CBS, and nucleotidyltransferase domain
MDCVRVRDIMIPLALYATVSEVSSFYETVLALKVAQRQFGQHRETPKTILVFDKEARISGQIDYWDLLRAIEPRYATMGYPRQIIDRECSGCKFAGSILTTYGLWREPLQELCAKSAEVMASEIMRPITAMECIEEQVSMEEAINSMIMRHIGLMIVTRGGEAVGVLRLADVADKILYRIKECRVPLIDGGEKQSDNLAA